MKTVGSRRTLSACCEMAESMLGAVMGEEAVRELTLPRSADVAEGESLGTCSPRR